MTSKDEPGIDRRELLKTLGIAGGVVATGVTARVALGDAAPAHRGQEQAPPARASGATSAQQPDDMDLDHDAVRAYFGALRPGAHIERWMVHAVHGVRLGAIAVILQTATGEHFQVDVLRRVAGADPVIASTRNVSVFLLNGGNGSTATVEAQGLGAMALARALDEREVAGAVPPTLLSLDERNARFPRGAFRVAT